MGPIALSWTPLGPFHHVGFVIAAIRDVAQGFAQSIDSEWDGDIIYDPHQQVRVTFLRSKAQADPLNELIEPVGDKSPVLSFLKRGGGLHHLCYLVDSLEKQLETCSSRGMVVLRPPLPAVAFGNRRIAWVCTNNNLLIEYLER